MVYSLIAVTILLYMLAKQNGGSVDIATLLGFGSLRSPARMDVQSLLALAAIVLIALAITMSGPEVRVLLVAIDAIGFDVLVVLFTLQIRSIAASVLPLVRDLFARCVVRLFWIPAICPRPAVVVSFSMIAVLFGIVWIGAQIGRRLS